MENVNDRNIRLLAEELPFPGRDVLHDCSETVLIRRGKKILSARQHSFNLEELNEMETFVPMTLYERNRLRRWVYSGHSVHDNPWNYYNRMFGYRLDYLEGLRRYLTIKYGTMGGFFCPENDPSLHGGPGYE